MRGFAVGCGGVLGGEGAEDGDEGLGLAGVFAWIVEGAGESRVGGGEVAGELGETGEVGVEQEIGSDEALELLANVGACLGSAGLRAGGVEGAHGLFELAAHGCQELEKGVERWEEARGAGGEEALEICSSARELGAGRDGEGFSRDPDAHGFREGCLLGA